MSLHAAPNQPSADLMQSVLNAVPDAVIGMDAAGRVRLISPAAANVLGYEGGIDDAPAPTQWLAEFDVAQMEERSLSGLYLRARGVHVSRFEATARRSDGTQFPCDVSLTRTDAQDGLRYVCVVRDMTEQRMADAMLNLYMRALDCATNGVVICDMSMAGAPIFHANPAFCEITGYGTHELIGRPLDMLVSKDASQPALRQLRSAFALGESCTAVLRWYRKDGALFFAEISVAPVRGGDQSITHYVCIVSDVSERERARMAIAERSERLNAIFELSSDGFVVFDANMRLVYCNRAFLRMTGNVVAADETIDIQAFDSRFARLCDAQQPPRPLAQILQRTDIEGDVVTITMPERRILKREWRSHSGPTGETILYLRDITRETEVDRMKSEFLTTAAHELRTPMVSVYGFTELLLNRPVSDDRRRDMLETIHRQSRLLISMVNELLDLARIEARQGKDLKLARHRLGDIVDRALAGFLTPGQSERLRVELPHAECMVFADEDKIIRALTNVMSNAFKYSPEGGPVALKTRWGRIGGDEAVGIDITDSGIGMSPEQSSRVFERFYRADPSGNIPGTGLGMSLVKEIVELHGGRVELVSELGHGTRVTLWWPLRTQSTGASAL